MKHFAKLSAVLVLSLATIPAVHAQMNMDMKGMKSDKKAEGQVHKAAGTVTKVDPAGSAVTIAHGPVQSMSWPSMTMAFKVKDKALLDKVTVGKKVDFEFVQEGRDYIVTSVK